MRTDNGYVPSLRGPEFRLGDYGYFKGDEWRLLGNLKDLTEVRLRKESRGPERIETISMNAMVVAHVGAKAEYADQNVGMAINFTSKHSFYQLANVDHHLLYSSIPEVEGVLKVLAEAGVWEKKYHLIVDVIYAKSFLTVLSKTRASGISFGARLDTVQELSHRIKTGVDIGLRVDSGDVSVVEKKIDSQLGVCAARFVHLRPKSFWNRALNAEYLGQDNNQNLRAMENQEGPLEFSEELEECENEN